MREREIQREKLNLETVIFCAVSLEIFSVVLGVEVEG